MTKLHIQNATLIDPTNHLHRFGDVTIADGVIVSVGDAPADFTADTIIDASGQILCAGFIDLSTRLRDMGHSRKATFASETRAAASAGVTSVCLQPDTRPPLDTPAVLEHIKDLATQANYPSVYSIAALTQRLEGAELSSMLSLKQAGCVAVSNANLPIKNLLILRRAMEYAASHDVLFIYRPNEFSLSNNGCAHEGAVATRYGLPSIPEAAETIALDQCLELAELTGCRVHFGQISCRRSVIKIHQAKKYGLAVSADVAMHSLHLSEDDMIAFDSNYHVLPPLRSEIDRDYLVYGLANGTINAISSDHQPHDSDAKLAAFPETEAGISSLETLLPLLLKLVSQKVITLDQGIAALTCNPARILGLNSGALTVGFAADLCIFNPTLCWQINAQTWQSAGKNTPFWGQTLIGRVTHTLQAGRVIYSINP